jgi:hypothetical protein
MDATVATRFTHFEEELAFLKLLLSQMIDRLGGEWSPVYR